MDWTERQCCLRCKSCNKGDKLLVCYGNGCPIVVHNECLGCEAQFDNFGNFYCPYCIFKQVTEEMHQLRDKAMLARKNLLKFIKEEMGDGNGCFDNNLKSDDFGNHRVHLEEQHLEERPPTCTSTPLPCDETDELIVGKKNGGALQRCSRNADINECGNNMMMVVYQPRLNPFGLHDDGDHVQCEEITHLAETLQLTKKVKAEPVTEVDECQYENVNEYEELAQNSSPPKRTNNHSKVVKQKQTEVNCTQEQVRKNTESVAPDILPAQSRSLKRKNPPEVNSLRRSKRESHSKQFAQPSKQNANSPFSNAKRGRMFWTAEEEDMLKEGFEKFSVAVNKKIPWRKILDFGHHVFDASRTPTDLKDKWRNVLAKDKNR